MRLYPQKSYQDYKEQQIKTNIRKLHNDIAEPHRISYIINWLKTKTTPKFGLCHGVRNGWEVRYFRDTLKCNVIGTDISPTVTQFENCIEWDFHKVKDEWIGKFDFIYSNSWDHSHSPRYCIYQWMRCLKPTGFCFLEWFKNHGTGADNIIDCFAASFEDLVKIFTDMHILYDYILDDPLYNNKFKYCILFNKNMKEEPLPEYPEFLQ